MRPKKMGLSKNVLSIVQFLVFNAYIPPHLIVMSVIVCKLSNILRPHPIFPPAYQKAGGKIFLPLLGKANAGVRSG